MSPLKLRVAIAASVLLILLSAAGTVWQFEQTLAEGKIVTLELAPVDPRSLMQGDYMALAFALDRQLPNDAGKYHYAWLNVDAKGVASLHSVSQQLPEHADMIAMRLRPARFGHTVGPNGFFFTEGEAKRFEAARYGQFRVDKQGKALLTGLLDEHLQLLGENKR